MKKILAVLTALFVAFALVSCGGDPGSTGGDDEPPVLPVLFDGTLWIEDVGTVTAYNDDGFTTEITLGSGGYSESTGKVVVLFENPIDLSAYSKVVFTVVDANSGWHGGVVFFNAAHDANVDDWGGSGNVNNTLTLDMVAMGATSAQLAVVSGFTICTGNDLKVTKIEVTN